MNQIAPLYSINSIKLKLYQGVLLLGIFFIFLEVLFFFTGVQNGMLLNNVTILYSDSILKLAFYLFTIILCIASMGVVPMLKNKILSGVSGTMIICCYTIDLIYSRINGRGMSFNELPIIFTEYQNNFLNTISYYFPQIIVGIIAGIFIMILFILVRRQSQGRISNISMIYPIFSILLVLSIQLKTGATFTLPLPSFQKISSYLIYWNLYPSYYGDREPLKIQPEFQKKYQNIVWILDCSVNGKYLGINNKEFHTTPFLSKNTRLFKNAGTALSVTNCSATTNIFLMGVGHVNDLPDFQERLLKSPSIFAFAKNAGYKTAYLSAQSHGSQLQNYMTKYDLEDLDYFHQPTTKNEKNETLADELLAEEIINYLNQNGGSFIYAVKSGSHFPWQNNYPSNEEIFQPSMGENESISSSDSLLRLNTYLNSIRWKTDHFFQTLLSDKSILDNTLIIYTSDHGQVINGNSNQTHCSTHNPEIDEGIVPLLFFSNDLQRINKLSGSAITRTHFEIIPITKIAMGYDVQLSQSKEVDSFFYGHLFPKNQYQQNGNKFILNQ